jgi:F0F1-type ATP synthase assembly protein I
MPDFATNTHETTRQLNRSHGSFELALAPVILGLLGLWLDRTIGTVPLFLVLFTVCGFAGAGIKIYYTYRYQMEQHQSEVAWKGHDSSESFRTQSSARAERLSVGSAEVTDPAAEVDSATKADVSASKRASRG